MPNKPHAIKKQRVDKRRHTINRVRLSRLRTYIKKVEADITAGKQKDAMVSLKAAASELHRGAQKKLIKPNHAARKISRLNQRIKYMKKQAA
ncbi:MAG: 30S ribosomal protein S20 [Alphaproteobacteria bacterium]